MNKYLERLYNGIIKENPTFIIMLGMCPTLATTTSAMNGLGMGLSTAAVLMFSNMLISALRKIIPERMRLPGEIVVVASLVTIVQLLIQAYVPALYEALGIYIPLIVVNCIILGRAESFALFNDPVLSFFDGLGMGIGFTFALTVIGAVRELIGAGTIFNFSYWHPVPSWFWRYLRRFKTNYDFPLRQTGMLRRNLFAEETAWAVFPTVRTRLPIRVEWQKRRRRLYERFTVDCH